MLHRTFTTKRVHSISTVVQRSRLGLRLGRCDSPITTHCRPRTSQKHLLTDVEYPGNSNSCPIEGCRRYLRAPLRRDCNHECDLLPKVCPACCASGLSVAHEVFGCGHLSSCFRITIDLILRVGLSPSFSLSGPERLARFGLDTIYC